MWLRMRTVKKENKTKQPLTSGDTRLPQAAYNSRRKVPSVWFPQLRVSSRRVVPAAANSSGVPARLKIPRVPAVPHGEIVPTVPAELMEATL